MAGTHELHAHPGNFFKFDGLLSSLGVSLPPGTKLLPEKVMPLLPRGAGCAASDSKMSLRISMSTWLVTGEMTVWL